MSIFQGQLRTWIEWSLASRSHLTVRYPEYFNDICELGLVVGAQKLTCDPTEVAHVEIEIAANQHNLGVGVIDLRTGLVRLFTYDETDAFSRVNPHRLVMAGHEAAAAMAGFPLDLARGFVLGIQGNDRHVFNSSHLNRLDGQGNTLQMAPQTFHELVAALQVAGVRQLIAH